LDGAAVIEIGIITAPRVKPTITKSIDTLRKAGFGQEITIFAEPGSDIPVCDGCHIVQHKTVRGNFRNWVFALQALAATTAEWIMICEDDIQWSRDAMKALEHDLARFVTQSSAGALSLYCPIRMSKVLEKKYGTPLVQGWYGLNLGRSTWGAQCLVFHRTWAMSLLTDRVLKSYLDDPHWHKNVDALIADVIARSGREIMYRIPCLVDHTFGDGNSSLGYKPDRPELRTKYFRDQVQ
jgi:hypothetical protein